MWTTIRHLRKLRSDRRGVSNVIVMVLSLVILVIIASNVILWSYHMNQLDWEKTQESMTIINLVNVNTTYSRWSTVKAEYQVNLGSHVSGSFINTQTIDGNWETFQEENNPLTYRLDFNGTFILDLTAYPLSLINTVEVQMRYRASDTLEKRYLKAYNWTSNAYSDGSFNNTFGHAPSGGWDYYAVNFTDKWQSYVRDDGIVVIKLHDEKNDAVRTTIEVDFLGVRIVTSGVAFTFKNNGSLTAHVVSLWIINSIIHNHYDVNVFINSGENETYLLSGVQLPSKPYFVKAITERGNIAVYSPN